MDITNKVLGYCIIESIDKRLIRRIPYLLFVATISIPLIYKMYLFYKQLIIILSFTLLFITTIYLSAQLKSLFEQKLFEDVSKLSSFFNLRKIRRIIEDNQSFLDELIIQSGKVLVLGFLNSMSSFVFLWMVIVIVLERYYEFTILITLSAISGLFILRDLLKSDIADTKFEENKILIASILEKYFVQNSLKRLFGTRTVANMIFKMIYRLFTPMIFVELPKIESKQFLVHTTENLAKFLKSLMNESAEERKEKLSLKHVNGTALTQLLVLNERNNCANIEDLENKCFEDLFSYIFDSENKHKKRNWSITAVYRGTKIVSLMFVQCFKVAKRSANGYKPSTALHILIIGSKDVVEFLSLAISMKSVNVKPDEMFYDPKKFIKHYRKRRDP